MNYSIQSSKRKQKAKLQIHVVPCDAFKKQKESSFNTPKNITQKIKEMRQRKPSLKHIFDSKISFRKSEKSQKKHMLKSIQFKTKEEVLRPHYSSSNQHFRTFFQNQKFSEINIGKKL